MSQWSVFGIALLYAAAVVAVAVVSGYGVKTFRAFAVGTTASARTQTLSFSLFVTVVAALGPFAVVSMGFSGGIPLFAASIAVPIAVLLLAIYATGRLHRFAHMLSLAEMMGSYYGSLARFFMGIAGVCLCLVVITLHVRMLGNIAHMVLGLPGFVGVIAGCILAALVVSLGGMPCLGSTHTMHVLFAVLTLPALCSLPLQKVGGYNKLFEAFAQVTRNDFSSLVWPCIAVFVALLLPLFDPAVGQRLLMIEQGEQGKKTMGLTALLMVPFFVVLGVVGMLARLAGPDVPVHLAVPYMLTQALMGPLAVVITVGAVALLLAGIESYLHAASVSFVNDILRPLYPSKRPITRQQELFVARVSAWGLAAVAVVLSLGVGEIAVLLRYWYPVMVLPVLSCIFQWKLPVRSFAASVLITFVALNIWAYFYDYEDVTVFVPFYATLVGFIFSILGMLFTYNWESDPLIISGLQELKPKLPAGILAYLPTPQNVLRFCTRRVQAYGEQYTTFGAFALVNYMLPFFMWFNPDVPYYDTALYLRITSGVVCFMMVVREKWLQHWHYYMPVVWYFALFFCLPFSGTYMFLSSGAETIWMVNMALVLLMLSILVDWTGFFVLLTLGVGLGYSVFWLQGGDIMALYDELSYDDLYLAVYVNVFVVLIGGILSRNPDKLRNQCDEGAHCTSADVAHDVRPQMVSIALRSQHAAKHMPTLLQAYQQAKQAGLCTQEIAESDYDALQQLATHVQSDAYRVLWFINTLRTNLLQYPPAMEHELQKMTLYSMTECMEEMLQEYPFESESQRRLVMFRRTLDFPIRGHKKPIKQMLANLVTNALQHTGRVPHPRITLCLERDRISNMVSVRNNGPSIHDRIQDRIFDRFYSTQGHVGLGLTYCREVMHRYLGEIVCRSDEGKPVEFLLVFPKWKPDSKNWVYYVTEGIKQMRFT